MFRDFGDIEFYSKKKENTNSLCYFFLYNFFFFYNNSNIILMLNFNFPPFLVYMPLKRCFFSM